jgi:hypothetical protein
MLTCKTCGKTIKHESEYCLQHRREWREGFKAGVRTKESVGDANTDRLIKDLELISTYPIAKALGIAPLMIRSANAIKRLSKK